MTALSRAARTASRPGLARRIIAGTLGAAVATVALPLMSAPSAHAVTGVGATAAFGPSNTVIPQWYSDATGLRLQPCLVATAVCFQVPGLAPGAAGFAAPNGEAFYWVAFGNLNTAGTLGPVASQLTMGVEAAFAPAPGPDVFNRVRFRIGVPTPGVYTVTYPYGRKTFNVTALGRAGRDINDTTDSGALVAPPNFANVVGPCPAATGCVAGGTGGPFEPFLTLDATLPAPPAGFISDGVSPHGVVGSPTGNNFFRVEGPGINPNPADPATACTAPAVPGPNCVQTNLFVVNGQLAPGLNAAPGSLTFPATAAKATSAAQTVTVTNSAAAAITVGAPTVTGAFAVASNTCAAVAAGGTCTIGVTFKPTAQASPQAR